MLFNSFIFLFFFLPLALGGFLLAARIGRVVAGIWLIVASLVFYSWWNPAFLPLLLISIAFNYTAGELLFRLANRPKLQSLTLALAIAGDLGALFYFKYFAALAGFMAGLGIGHQVDPIILPLGISFFTFTQIGYLVDVKQGEAEDRGFLNYCLFVTFFPHLIAGPILHNREMMPQFAKPETYRFSLENLNVGLVIFIIGLFKKTILADPLASGVGQGFTDAAHLGTFDAWRTACSYSLQLYFDFSGYSDMAIGLARMFNVRFPINFDSPYKAQSVVEYWQRWHMTLTRYLTLYLYNPMALAIARWRGERGLKSNRAAQATLSGFAGIIALPTFLTMFLSGIWHGVGQQFLVWGCLHAAYLIINHAISIFFPSPKNAPTPPAWRAHLMRIRNVGCTYVAVVIGLVFFRAPSLDGALSMLGGMMALHHDAVPQAVGMLEMLSLAVLYAIIWGLPNVQQIMTNFEPAIGKPRTPLAWPKMAWNAGMGWAVGLGAMLALAVLGMGGTSEFLYFQF